MDPKPSTDWQLIISGVAIGVGMTLAQRVSAPAVLGFERGSDGFNAMLLTWWLRRARRRSRPHRSCAWHPPSSPQEPTPAALESSRQYACHHVGRHRQYVDPAAGRITFEAYFRQWSKRQVWTANTHRAMTQAVRSTTFAGLQVREIKTSHVEAWVRSMSARLEPSTIKTRFTNVRSVFRAAQRDRLLPHNPTAGVRLPRPRKREAQVRIPTPGEVRALLDAADDRFRVFLALRAFAGPRLGEAAALQLGDVDFLRRTIGVHRQVQRAGRARSRSGCPSTEASATCTRPDELLQLLAAMLEDGIREPWLFVGDGDQSPHQNTIGHRWRQTCRLAGVRGVACTTCATTSPRGSSPRAATS